MSAVDFARELQRAEERLRALGLTGRGAYAALCRSLAHRLGLPRELWLDGPDAPTTAGLASIPLTAELDLFGLAYERFFPEVFKAERGQFFTPRPVVELMAELADVRVGQRVLDPTCGSGAFLVVAHARGADVDGFELDPELVALCRLNLKLHGANPRAVRHRDLFRHVGGLGPLQQSLLGTDAAPDGEQWDVVLANPPFSVDVDDAEALAGFTLARGRRRVQSDALFIEAAWRLLRPGGRLAAVLPRSLLANQAFSGLRDWIDAHFVRQAVVALPEGVFRPFGGAASRACVVVLARRPGRLQPWLAAEVQRPGYDPTRRAYKPTEPDELSALRLAVAGRPQAARDPGVLHDIAGPGGGRYTWVEAPDAPWLPAAALARTGLGAQVPTTPLCALAPYTPRPCRPSDTPSDPFTRIDLADVDKATGEVTSSHAELGRDFAGAKSGFDEGDVLVARIRPSLNTVAMARRPDPQDPPDLVGSSEWLRLVPLDHPHFVLVAARSSFVRNQLQVTDGQTRPRIQPPQLQAVQVPDPGPVLRARLDALVGDAMAVRHAARRRMDAVAALYEAFGRGELDAAALGAALDRLEGDIPGG